MATSSYCGTHDIRYRGSECPRCVADNRHEESLRQQREASEQQRDLLSNAQYQQFNPGHYNCPHCLFQSLKRNASRCPLCHGVIDGEYWVQVQKGEKEAVARRAEIEAKEKKELERTRPERERLAREQEQKNARDAKLDSLDKVFLVFSTIVLGLVGIFFVFLVPYLSAWSTNQSPRVGSFGLEDGNNGANPLMLIPVFNWMILLVYGIFGRYGGLMLEFTGFWALCGVGGVVALLILFMIFLCVRQAIKSGQ